MTNLFADIVLPLPLDRAFTYQVPPHLREHIQLGSRVSVPFGRKTLVGVVVELPEKSPVASLRSIRDVLDPSPLFSPEMLRFTRWVSDYYLTAWGEVLKSAAPQLLTFESHWIATLKTSGTSLVEAGRRAPLQRRIIEHLKVKGSASLRDLQASIASKALLSTLHSLADRNILTLREELGSRRIRAKSEPVVGLTQAGLDALARPDAALRLTGRQAQILEHIATRAEGNEDVIGRSQLLQETGSSLSVLRVLEGKGLVRMFEREVIRAEEYDQLETPPRFALSPHQRSALEAIGEALDEGRFEAFLLHGVTGSGKTQVYIEAIRRVIDQGRRALVLVPEIALTPQTVRRFKAHFRESVVVLHSQLSPGQRYDAWRLAHSGKAAIVIGPRSAVFAPLRDLGIIVVDEEQESSYKQYDLHPRYHARDLAVVRASQSKCVVVLGSATPSTESYANAREGKYRLLELPERVDGAVLPTVVLVDMAEDRRERFEQIRKEVAEKRREFPRPYPQRSISMPLEREIQLRLKAKQGVILLQNRRGFSHVVECFECGFVERCDRCAVTLTYHLQKKHLRCHYCGLVKPPPGVCPSCGGADIRFHAFGTQQVHTELEAVFPEARILRMDLDTTQRRGAHDQILRQFAKGDADILLGTQMVAKGLDFPRVTLVGVISADTQMLLPDFRSSERTFQLLTQVAGRAGRGSFRGEVIIQTLQPTQYSLRYVVGHDYRGFFDEEMHYRKELSYPPFARLALLEFRGTNEAETGHRASQFAAALAHASRATGIKILGPSDAAIPKVKDRFRKQLLLKSPKETDPSGSVLRFTLAAVRADFEKQTAAASRAVTLSIDIDPQGML